MYVYVHISSDARAKGNGQVDTADQLCRIAIALPIPTFARIHGHAAPINSMYEDSWYNYTPDELVQTQPARLRTGSLLQQPVSQ